MQKSYRTVCVEVGVKGVSVALVLSRSDLIIETEGLIAAVWS